MKHYTLLIIMLLLLGSSLYAQTVESKSQLRTSFTAKFDLFKKIKLNISPELRFDEKANLDKYLMEGELIYKPLKSISLATEYRFVGNTRENKSTLYGHRFGLSTKYKKQINNFEPSIGIKYTYYTEDDYKVSFLRYKANLAYAIPKLKLTPFVGVEAFHNVDETNFNKIRYEVGLEYKLFKKNYISLSYNLDYYLQELVNKHIFKLNYTIKF